MIIDDVTEIENFMVDADGSPNPLLYEKRLSLRSGREKRSPNYRSPFHDLFLSFHKD